MDVTSQAVVAHPIRLMIRSGVCFLLCVVMLTLPVVVPSKQDMADVQRMEELPLDQVRIVLVADTAHSGDTLPLPGRPRLAKSIAAVEEG